MLVVNLVNPVIGTPYGPWIYMFYVVLFTHNTIYNFKFSKHISFSNEELKFLIYHWFQTFNDLIPWMNIKIFSAI